MKCDLSACSHATTTSEFFATCLDVLGMTTMKTACRRSQAQIYKYARDTAHRDDSYQNPADLIIDLNARMTKLGHRETAMDILRVMASAIGCNVVEAGPVVPDKETVADEILDDHDVMNTFYNVLRQTPTKRRVPLVKALGDDCKREIDENVAKYEQVANDAE